MAFASKRGRPKQHKPEQDYGTPELLAKREAGLTREPLDVCFDKGLITKDQHWCGLHLRWLYTLRYGAPGISCRPLHLDESHALRGEDDQWRLAREAEYKEAITYLNKHRAYEPVMGVCVFHDAPDFLNRRLLAMAQENAKIAHHIQHSYQQLSEGLSVLCALWRPK